MPDASANGAHDDAAAQTRSEAQKEAPNGSGPGAARTGGADGSATTGLLLLAVAVVLYVGEAVFLPVAAAVLLYFLFAPVVRFGASWGIPRTLSATGVMVVILAVLGLSIYGLSAPAGTWMKRLPQAVERVGTKLQALRLPMDQVTAAAQQMEELSKAGPHQTREHGASSGGDATAADAKPASSAAPAPAAGQDKAKIDGNPGTRQPDQDRVDQDQADANQTQPAANAAAPDQKPTGHDAAGDEAPAAAADRSAGKTGNLSAPAHGNTSTLGGRGRANGSVATTSSNSAGTDRTGAPAPSAPAERGADPSVISVSQPSLLAPYLLSGTFGVIGFLGELFITLVTLFFLLSTGGTLLHRAVVLIPALRRNPDPMMVYSSAPKTDAAAVLSESERQVGTYLRTTLIINTCLGMVISTLFWLVGMPNPVLWGVMAGVLNFLPYVGPVIGVIVVFLAGLITFDTVAQAVVAPLIYVGCAFLEGNLLTPWIMGMRLALSPLAIFLWMMVWGFMWGAAGAIIAVPLLVMVREFCQRIDGLAAVGRLIEP